MHIQSYNCALYSNSFEETVEHLFLQCDFARECWNLVGVTVPQSQDPFQVLEVVRAQLNVPFFMEIIFIMSWRIWTVRYN
jgi:hypothetical protein